jgi:hypothetical protein
MLTLTDIVLFLPFILGAAYWWRASEQKTIAVNGARQYCKQRNMQLLDDSLVFSKFRLERNLYQERSLCRVYEFDYSPDGRDRRTGQIVLHGNSILRVILQSDVLEITQY